MAELVPRVWRLCELAAASNISLTIDAEEVGRLELSLDVFEALAVRVARHCPQWRGFGLALQPYQSRGLELVDHVVGIARKHELRLMCRLVKGAYRDSEIKRAQEMDLPHYPVFTHKHHTDVSYLACAAALLAAPDAVYLQFAGHDAGTIAAILQMADLLPRPSGERAGVRAPRVELQRLHGMGEGIFREVLKNPHIACRVYAPVGAHRDLLAYLVRRLLENRANFILRASARRRIGRHGRAADIAAAPGPRSLLAAAARALGTRSRQQPGAGLDGARQARAAVRGFQRGASARGAGVRCQIGR